MTHYADTSFLCSIYRQQIHTDAALRLRRGLGEALCFTKLLEFEFLQSIELQVWLNSNDRTKGYRTRNSTVDFFESAAGAITPG